MRLSQSFFVTQRNYSDELTTVSHRLMVQAGMLFQVTGGIYIIGHFLTKVIQKITDLVRTEMNTIDAQEISMPILQPKSLWVESRRWDQYKNQGLMFTLRDRKEAEYCLSPTNEELAVDFIRNRIISYRQLPCAIYQFGEKFRDEIRPRFGLMRGREFTMKDAYSFHESPKDLEEWYAKFRNAYANVLNRLNLRFGIVEADNGEMGGTKSEEFMAIADAGEDELVFCSSCGSAVNVEKAGKKDQCTKCGSMEIRISRGIEIGHIFQLGGYYSKNMGLTFTSKDGTEEPIIMGCYGMGISRLAAAVVEQSHDENGIIWPSVIAPFDAIVIPARPSEIAVNAAIRLYEDLKDQGIDCILDDRDASAAVKFKDADLTGIPWKIIVGKTFESNGEVELKDRRSKNSTQMKPDNVARFLLENQGD